MPDTVEYGHRPREDLALLGLISSPLQMIWVYGHLRFNFYQSTGLAPLPSPEQLLEAYKTELLRISQPLFQQQNDGLRTHVT